MQLKFEFRFFFEHKITILDLISTLDNHEEMGWVNSALVTSIDVIKLTQFVNTAARSTEYHILYEVRNNIYLKDIPMKADFFKVITHVHLLLS